MLILASGAGLVETLTLPKASGPEVSNPSVVRVGDGKHRIVYKGMNYNLRRGGRAKSDRPIASASYRHPDRNQSSYRAGACNEDF